MPLYFPSVWRLDYGNSYFRACGGGRYGDYRKAGWLNNYAGVLYMQGACIFMHGGWLWNVWYVWYV